MNKGSQKSGLGRGLDALFLKRPKQLHKVCTDKKRKTNSTENQEETTESHKGEKLLNFKS